LCDFPNRYNFICERWFARDREDGLIDRVLTSADTEEALTFERRFGEYVRLELTDSHLWLSCAMRPERSAFTRAQRVSCCVGLLLLTMITSAMFYQPEDNETGESTSEGRVLFLLFEVKCVSVRACVCVCMCVCVYVCVCVCMCV
jgi:hypothetical protein